MSYTYALDPTGINPTNLIRNESHVLTTSSLRAFAPNFGSFFTESMKLYDLGDGSRELVKGVDYYPTDIAELPSGIYNKEICNLIVISNETVSNEVMLTYQVLGGFYENPARDVEQQIASIVSDGNHKWKWGNIFVPVRPSQYPPVHYTDRNDIRIGFEYQEHAIDRITKLLIEGYPEAQSDLYKYIDSIFGLVREKLNNSGQLLTDHINNDNNPHVNTPDQLNVYTKTEVNNTRDQMYAEFDARATQIEQILTAHINNRQNPHGITAALLQMWTKEQTDARLAQMVANAPKADNGFWQLLYNGYTGGWSHYNDYSQAVLYSFTDSNGSGRVGNQMYVDGQLIADAMNQHTNWQKSIQTYIMVPGKTTVTINTNTASSGGGNNVYALRFVPTA